MYILFCFLCIIHIFLSKSHWFCFVLLLFYHENSWYLSIGMLPYLCIMASRLNGPTNWMLVRNLPPAPLPNFSQIGQFSQRKSHCANTSSLVTRDGADAQKHGTKWAVTKIGTIMVYLGCRECSEYLRRCTLQYTFIISCHRGLFMGNYNDCLYCKIP